MLKVGLKTSKKKSASAKLLYYPKLQKYYITAQQARRFLPFSIFIPAIFLLKTSEILQPSRVWTQL
jgi:hypothetical protein